MDNNRKIIEDFQLKYPTGAERAAALRKMSYMQIQRLIDAAPSPYAKNSYAKYLKDKPSGKNNS